MNEGSTTRVLVVEDSASQARRLVTVLAAAGYAVEHAGDGLAGWAAFEAGGFDLVLSDVLMPGLSGYDLCRKIKADPRGARVPFVLLTSLGRSVDLVRGLECGADNYIYKPFESDALLARIRTILANSAGRAAGGDDVLFMGHPVRIAAGKEQILDYLGSTFEDFVQARHREYEAALAREKQNAQAEASRVREEMLRQEKENLGRLHQFLQSSLDALATRIAILDAAGTVLAVNAAWRRPGGADPLAGPCDVGANYLGACEAADGGRDGEARAVAAGIREVMARGRDEFSREYPCPTPEGRRWFNVRVTRFGAADAVRVVVAHEDITPRKAAEEQILHEASHDALTGLPNRALLADRLGRAVDRAKRSDPSAFAVLFLDLDGFKVVNDSLGHMAGDELLVGIGRRLAGCVRGGDTVARLGGDEFAILVTDVHDPADVLRLADRVQQALSLPFALGGHEVFTSASVGIAFSDPRYDRPVEVLRDADTAMYRAKALGKAHHVVFDRAMHTHAVNRLRLETDLRRAVERDEFWVAYQPIVSLDDGRITGFEALARWQHPERGPVPPAEFIPAAEETGLIIPLDAWVFREACRQVRAWHDEFPADVPLRLSVNLSSKHFAHPDLVDRIDAILAETGVDPSCLRMEITESVIMGQPESAAAKLRQIKQRGIRLSMDDFGTGYSSLSYLHKFPFDVLKIDRSFVSRIGPRGEGAEIAATIVALAHSLGMETVAEGVETAAQAAHLRSLRCHYGQGYHFARPLAAAEATALLARSAAAPAFAVC
jgi:diguanylate cyclase (GGDEF)-like protein